MAATSRLALMTAVWKHIKANDIRDEKDQLVQVDKHNYKELCYLYGIEVPDVIYMPDGATERRAAKAAEKKPKFIPAEEIPEEKKTEIEQRRSSLIAPD
jgi:hypothetical protein